MANWQTLEEFVWNDPLDGSTRTYYPDHTEVSGRKYYIDRTILKNGKVKQLRKQKKGLMDKILFDGRFLITPDYKDGKNHIIDTTTNRIIGSYMKKHGVAEVNPYIVPLQRFPISQWTILEAMNLDPVKVARNTAGINYITQHAVTARFPSSKSIEVYMEDKNNSVRGYFRYYIGRGWQSEVKKDRTIITPTGKLVPKTCS